MRVAIPPLPNTSSWRGTQLKNRDNFTFTFTPSNTDKVKVKSKVIPVLFERAPRHEGVLGEWRNSSTHSLTSALDGGEWSASRPDRFTPKD
jgi:hypothetical protein